MFSLKLVLIKNSRTIRGTCLREHPDLLLKLKETIFNLSSVRGLRDLKLLKFFSVAGNHRSNRVNLDSTSSFSASFSIFAV